MDIKRVRDITFYFKKESVIMQYRDKQFIGFHSYNSGNKEHFYNFKDKLRKVRNIDLNSAFALASRHKVSSMLTTSASIRPLPPKVLAPTGGSSRNTRIIW